VSKKLSIGEFSFESVPVCDGQTDPLPPPYFISETIQEWAIVTVDCQ